MATSTQDLPHWVQPFMVPPTWTGDDGARSAVARFVCPALDTPSRWVHVFAALVAVGFAVIVLGAVRDGFGWLDLVVVPYVCFAALTSGARYRTLLRLGR